MCSENGAGNTISLSHHLWERPLEEALQGTEGVFPWSSHAPTSTHDPEYPSQ